MKVCTQRHAGVHSDMAAQSSRGQKPLNDGPTQPTTTLTLPLRPPCPNNSGITYAPTPPPRSQLQPGIFHKCLANVTSVFYTFHSLIKLMCFPFGQIVITSDSLWLGFEVNVL